MLRRFRSLCLPTSNYLWSVGVMVENSYYKSTNHMLTQNSLAKNLQAMLFSLFRIAGVLSQLILEFLDSHGSFVGRSQEGFVGLLLLA